MISPKVAIDFILTPGPERAAFYLSQIKSNSKGLTIPRFWFKLVVMRRRNYYDRAGIVLAACLILLAARPLVSAVKQVRVTVERASIYIEPSRSSARIEIVGKGAVLNLLQERKVKDIWYYVSFNSPRYGSRISGFIQDSAVEPIVEGVPAPSKKEEKAPPKVEPEQVRPPEAVPPPPAKEQKPLPKEPPAPPPVMETLSLTSLPKGRSYKLPRKEAALLETAWKTIEIAPVVKEKRPVEIREFALLTAAPKRRSINLPKKEKPLEDVPWQVIQPVVAKATKPTEKLKPKESVAPKPAPTEVKKKPAEAKPETKPAGPQPVKPAQIKPAGKGPSFITVGLGYGSSFGGAGGCLQLNTRMGLSLHAGGGFYPTKLIYSETDWVENKPLWSIGLKYYLPLGSPAFSPFIDVQYGGLRVEAAQVIVGFWDYSFVLDNEQKTLYGPSGLAGVEFRAGRFGISAAAGASYTTTSWEYLQDKLAFVFETGLVFHF
jgi:hypothetical protein